MVDGLIFGARLVLSAHAGNQTMSAQYLSQGPIVTFLWITYRRAKL
ncbi:hypothetical protein MUK42_28619 [Musa troglodytarum]|uniref:Uncharacterized protein n=1 Tax=Musa troglodytarum TaxID=320322 RepID=A0A9E7K932_9LILI|nr:hypothetical protein MUK42_28619 [Musa troglodytarum]